MDRDELERRLQKARQLGATEAQISAKRQQMLNSGKITQPSFGSKALKFGGEIIRPITDLGRAVGVGAGVLGAGLVGAGAKGYESLTGKKTNVDEGAINLANLLYSKGLTPRQQTNFAPTASTGQVVGEGARTGAGVGSFFVPGGKTLKTAVGLGALSGALYGADRGDKFSMGNVVGGALGGAAGGGAIYGGGKVLSALNKAVTQTAPRKMMNTVFKEPLKDTRASIQKGTKTLGEQALEKGERGLSDEKIYANAIQRLNQFEDELAGKLVNSKRTVLISEIKKDVAPLVEKYQKAGNTQDAANILNRIAELENYNGKAIPVATANEIKRTLYDEARNAYGKLSSENMEGIKAIARSLKENIAKKVEGADVINKQLSYNGRIADSLVDKIARSGRNNALGLTDAILSAPAIAVGRPAGLVLPLARRALGTTAVQTNIATGLNRLGAITGKETISRRLMSPTANYMGAKAGQAISSSLFSEPVENGYQNEKYNQTSNSPVVHTPSITPQVTSKQTSPISIWDAQKYGKEMDKMWVIHPSGKTIWNPNTKKWMEFDSSQMPKSGALTEAQQAKVDTGKAVANAYRMLTDPNNSIQSGFINAPIQGLRAKLGIADQDTLEFNTKIASIKAGIAKARAGTSFTPNEERMLNRYTPNVGDSRQELETKLSILMDMFPEVLQ